jgi:hypothetical protein
MSDKRNPKSEYRNPKSLREKNPKFASNRKLNIEQKKYDLED